MTNKQNPEEISALDSSKHGDSPNSLGKPDSIIEALSLMTKQLVSSITTLNSSMDHSFTEMNETLGNLAYVEESANEEGSANSDAEKETDKTPNKDNASTKDQNQRAGGRWTPTEALNHINYLEMLAIFLSHKALCGAHKNDHMQVQCDNTTAVSYINNIGGSKPIPCNEVTKQIKEKT